MALGVIFIGTILISLSCYNFSLTVLDFFNPNYMEESLVKRERGTQASHEKHSKKGIPWNPL